MKIKTNEAFKYGHRNVIPYLGEVQIGEDGTVEVPTLEVGQQVIDLEIGFEWADESQKKDESTTPTTTTTAAPVTTTTTVEPVTTTTEEVDETTTTTTVEASDETTTTTTEELGSKAEENELGAEEKDLILKSIDILKLTELHDLAKPFPAKEWSTLKKEQLQAYLKKQLA